MSDMYLSDALTGSNYSNSSFDLVETVFSKCNKQRSYNSSDGTERKCGKYESEKYNKKYNDRDINRYNNKNHKRYSNREYNIDPNVDPNVDPYVDPDIYTSTVSGRVSNKRGNRLNESEVSKSTRALKLKNESLSDLSLNYSENKNNVRNNFLEGETKKTCRCVSCSRKVEDVLHLLCKHFLCLVCGSEQLNRKYATYLEECLIEEHFEKFSKKHNINECLDDYKDKKKQRKRDIRKELYKKEILASVECCVCNVKSELSIDAIEMLTKIGFISSDVLNVHKIYFFNNDNKNMINNNGTDFNKKNFLLKDSTSCSNNANYKSGDFNETLNSDYMKNEDLKKLMISKEKYDYLNNQIDNLDKYSYICNICSHNEATLYCKDCVEYLCQPCFDNIHELDVLEKLNIKCKNVHDYYPIDKTGLNLKKLVKNPQICYNINEDEFDKQLKDIEDDDDFEEPPFETYDENDPKSKHKIQDKDSDFDKYDEEYFNNRIARFIEKKTKNEKNKIISEKLNGLVEEMKNDSGYESMPSSCKGSLGSRTTKSEMRIRKGITKRNMKKGTPLKRKKKNQNKKEGTNNEGTENDTETEIITDNENDICSFHSGRSELISSADDDDDNVYLNRKKRKEVCITNVRDILNKDDDSVIEKSNDVTVNNADFTVIQNIRCPEHFGYPIQYYCHTCCNKCFCSECAINGNHNMECKIENINTAFITILNKYLIKWNEIISDLINDLHRNFYESLKDTQSEWSSLLSECFCELNAEINYVVNILTKKEIEIIKNLNSYLENFKKENLEYEQLLKDKQNRIDEAINIIRSNKNQTDPVNLIKFYRENVYDISKVMLMNQDTSAIENLADVRESKIFFMDFYTSQLVSYLRHLQSIVKVDQPI